MDSIDGRKSQGRKALTVANTANKETANKGGKRGTTSRSSASLPSPAERFDAGHDEPAIRARRLQAQAQRSQKLHEYYDEVLAEIRASLARAPQR